MRSVWTNEEVSPDQPLWRYLRAQRFVESVQSRALHFPSARQFEDPFEGAVAVLPHEWPIDPHYGELENVDKAFEQLRRLTKISCWHCADYESDAMWRLYAGSRKGVAVRTTAARLQAGLQPFRLAPDYGEEQPVWGRIRHLDLHAERLRVGMEERFFIKHRAFEWEQEFRVVISVRMAEEFGVPVPAGSMSPSTLQSWWSRLTWDQSYPIPSALRFVTRARQRAWALDSLHQRCWGGHATRRVPHP